MTWILFNGYAEGDRGFRSDSNLELPTLRHTIADGACVPRGGVRTSVQPNSRGLSYRTTGHLHTLEWVGRSPKMPTQSATPSADERAWTHVVRSLVHSAWGSPPRISSCKNLRDGRVFRVVLDAGHAAQPDSVIVKLARRTALHRGCSDEHPPELANFFNECAILSALNERDVGATVHPRMYGVDRTHGVLIMEDLGEGGSLATLLRGSNRTVAEALLRRHAIALSRLHSAHLNDRNGSFGMITSPKRHHHMAPSPMIDGTRCAAALRRQFEAMQFTPARGFWSQLESTIESMQRPGPFTTVLHGDPCPDNCHFGRTRTAFFDFERSHWGCALLEAAFYRVGFPTCWCVGRLPRTVLEGLESCYREALCELQPVDLSPRRFERLIVEACGYWSLRCGSWTELATPDRDWGLASSLRRHLHRLDAVGQACQSHDHMLAFGRTAARWSTHMRRQFELPTHGLPMFPAWSR